MKRFFAISIPIIILIGAYFIWSGVRKNENQQSAYRMGIVDRGPVQVVVTATGTVSAVTTVQVGSQVSGTIKQLNVDFNSPVHKGQIIARLDPTFLQASVSEAEANLERAKATQSQAERDLTRMSDLAQKNLAAQADLDNAKTALEQAKASVKQTEAQLQRAKVNLDFSVITAPIDGVVISRNVDVGQTVAASLQAPTLFTIAQDLKQMQIATNIDEADIGHLEEGMDATFTVDSYPDLTFHAKVGQIRYASQVDNNVVTYPVILTVENPELKLRPGMTANVTVVTARRDETVRVPASALRFRPADYKAERGNGRTPAAGSATAAETAGRGSSGGKRWRAHADSTKSAADSTHKGGREISETRSMATVFVKGKDGKPEPKRIAIGINDGTYVELLSSELADGDSVIIGMASAASMSAQGVRMPPGMGGGGRH